MSSQLRRTQESSSTDSNEGTEAERSTLLIAYLLHGLGVFTVLTVAIAGVIVNHLKVNDTDSSFIRSHHRWLLRTFWFGLLWLVISSVLMMIGVGVLIYFVTAVWYIYRIVRGLLAFSERKPLPVP